MKTIESKCNEAIAKLILGIELTEEDKIIIDALNYIMKKYGSGKK